jgi:hypothetical protein
VPTRQPGTYSRSMGGRFLIEGYIDAYYTNATGEMIWRSCGMGLTVKQIAQNLTDRFEVEEATALDGVRRFLTRLEALGYIAAE